MLPLDFPRWKVWLTWATLIICSLYAIPSFLPKETTDKWPAVLAPRFNLGLDLSGGSFLLLEADTKELTQARLESMEDTVRTQMRTGDPKIQIDNLTRNTDSVTFTVRDITQLDTAVERMRSQTNGVGVTGQRDWNVSVVDTNKVVITPTQAGIDAAVDGAMDTARDVVRRRVDPDGTKEVNVIRQGGNRIVVEVPGLQNPEELKKLLGKPAKLEFKLVDLTATQEDINKGVAPIGSEILPMANGGGAIAVKRQVMVSGEDVANASQGFDQKDNSPNVSLTFNSVGAKKFAEATTDNVGKPFAIILDDKVLSAPNINEPILGGSASISGGGFTVESATELAVQLSAGKLPVSLKTVQESTVGPDLGADSIRKGAIAGIVATLAVIIFMIITYLRFGVYTTLALIFNAFMILGIMAMMNATLTLPGIAGFVLTIGAAVDANVLINERIREEIRRGRHTMQAVEFGYKEASRAIFDANITNVISAVIMFSFGSGPVRGFAVVLFIGIITSVFTGVTFTRLLVAQYLKRNRPKTLNI